MQYTKRWQLAEYGSPYDLGKDISEFAGIELSNAYELLEKAGKKIQGALSLSSIPIIKYPNGIRINGVAGLIRIAPGIELEISPKFLGLDENNIECREDFFFIATLSRYGRLLSSEKLKSTSGVQNDLHTLLARAITSMYWENHRRPLRNYKLRKFEDFSVDGDLDAESLFNPDSEGFLQTEVIYDRNNHFNAAILSAAKELLPNLRDPSTIAQLERIIYTLMPQNQLRNRFQKRSLPNRSKRWQPIYDLSIDILNGLGLSYQPASSTAPGYVFDTWRVWEDLLGVGLRMGFGDNFVKIQHQVRLGLREKVIQNNQTRSTNATVSPDFVISDPQGLVPNFLIDAKYKGNADDGSLRISEPDLYEALAFAHATSINKVFLAYPSLTMNSTNLGQVELFEKIIVKNVIVFGVEVQTKGISRSSGLIKFSNRCTEDFRKINLL